MLTDQERELYYLAQHGCATRDVPVPLLLGTSHMTLLQLIGTLSRREQRLRLYGSTLYVPGVADEYPCGFTILLQRGERRQRSAYPAWSGDAFYPLAFGAKESRCLGIGELWPSVRRAALDGWWLDAEDWLTITTPDEQERVLVNLPVRTLSAYALAKHSLRSEQSIRDAERWQ